MTDPFQREERYIVIKRKHLTDGHETDIRGYLAEIGVGIIECAVIESDWPEYETVWAMIEARVAGTSAAVAPKVLAAEGADPVLVEKVAALIREHHRTHVRQPDRTNEPRRTFHQGDKEAAIAILSAITDPTLAREEGYRKGIEDAAKVANDSITYCFNYSPTGYARRISNAIRALAEKAIQP